MVDSVNDVLKKEGIKSSYKIAMLGDAGVGKTCIVNRYIENSYNYEAVSTLGANYCAKTIDVHPEGVRNSVKVKL